MTQKEKKHGASVQSLLGIKSFTDYGLSTNKGELLFFLITPSNISVLSASAVEVKVRQLMLTPSSIPDLEIVCMVSSECFDENVSGIDTYDKTRNERVGGEKCDDCLS